MTEQAAQTTPSLPSASSTPIWPCPTGSRYPQEQNTLSRNSTPFFCMPGRHCLFAIACTFGMVSNTLGIVGSMLGIAGIALGVIGNSPVFAKEAAPSSLSTPLLEDLKQLDRDVHRRPGVWQTAPDRMPSLEHLKRNAYQRYLQKIDPLLNHLLSLQQRFNRTQGEITLQQLAAQTQEVLSLYHSIQPDLTAEDQEYHSWQLIRRAVFNLEDAVIYWRLIDPYRPPYRGSVQDADDDQYALNTKVQAALQAIQDLAARQQTTDRLDTLIGD
ncbi:MAG: hypothetical protein SFZ03_03800 [Candidatus Melainabacteria bacterium]|nr:hypothetical protein [Candidatus Melainabacteria bacterium]